MPAFQPPQVYFLAGVLIAFVGFGVVLLVVSIYTNLSEARDRRARRAEPDHLGRGSALET